MAISFVGSKTHSHIATSNQAVSLADLLDGTGATATLQENDLILVVSAHAGTATRTQAQMLPTGYTAVARTAASDTTILTLLSAYKFMGSTPDSTVTIRATAATFDNMVSAIYAFRGVDLTTPLDVAETIASELNGGLPDPAAITPITAGALILAAGAQAAPNGAGAILTDPGGYSTTTNHFRTEFGGASASREGTVAVGLKTDWVSGAYNPPAFTGGTADAGAASAAHTIALRPAPTAVTYDASATFTATSSATAQGRIRAGGSASLAAAGSAAATARLAANTAAGLSGTGTVTASPMLLAGASADFTGESTLSGSALRMAAAAATLQASGIAAGTAHRLTQGQTSLAAAGSATATLTRLLRASVAVSGEGSAAASARRGMEASTALTGVGTLTASGLTGGQQAAAAASLVGVGTIIAAATVLRAATVAMNGVGALAARAAVDRRGSAMLAGEGGLAVLTRLEAVASIALAGNGVLSATARLIGTRRPTVSRPANDTITRPTQSFSNRPAQMNGTRPRQATATRPAAISRGRR